MPSLSGSTSDCRFRTRGDNCQFGRDLGSNPDGRVALPA